MSFHPIFKTHCSRRSRRLSINDRKSLLRTYPTEISTVLGEPIVSVPLPDWLCSHKCESISSYHIVIGDKTKISEDSVEGVLQGVSIVVVPDSSSNACSELLRIIEFVMNLVHLRSSLGLVTIACVPLEAQVLNTFTLVEVHGHEVPTWLDPQVHLHLLVVVMV